MDGQIFNDCSTSAGSPVLTPTRESLPTTSMPRTPNVCSGAYKPHLALPQPHHDIQSRPRIKKPFQNPCKKMPKKRPQILKKAMDLLTLSIPIHKLKKPINQNLMSFKRARKIKHQKLLKHYNYTYIEEYQFSPPSTPLFNRVPLKNRSRKNFYSLFLFCRCSGNSSGGEEEEEGGYVGEDRRLDFDEDIGTESGTVDLEGSEGECDSVDRRAEKFIEKFYQEMRIQRQESVLQYTQMMSRGCD